MNRMLHKRLWMWSGLLLGLVILIGTNLLANIALKSARIDLTEQDLYTLSDGSRKLLSTLDEPVNLRLYLSREVATRLPGISTYAKRVKELLGEFERASGGLVRLRIIDPEPFSDEEDRALSHGMEGIPVDAGGSVLYFGLLAGGPTGVEEVIPFFSVAREEFLEYDLARAIHQVARPSRTVLGLLSTLPMGEMPDGMPMPGASPQPWVIVDQIQQFFDVRILDEYLPHVPAGVDVLMVVDPSGLESQALYAIDQFVLRGGRALVFVDPYVEAGPHILPGLSRDGYPFDELLKQWGLRLRSAAVAADINLAQRVRTVSQGRNMLVDYPVWMTLHSGLFDPVDVITAELGDVVMASAGILEVLNSPGITVSSLIETTSAAMAVDPARIGPGSDPLDLVRGYHPGGESLVLAARVSGRVNSAFPRGAPMDEAMSPENGPEHLASSVADTQVIVIADTDMLRDEYWVSVQQLLGTILLIPTAANHTLVINALENLAGDENLISIRSRGGHSRPFTLLDDVRRGAELRFLQKEQELLEELASTDARLREIRRQQSDAEGLILGERQTAELARFRDRKVEIRGQLREVRANLRKDMERIEAWVRFANIALVPLIIGIGGLLLSVTRIRRGA